MKRIEDLTEQEIRELTDDDVKILIKLKKAEEGISFLEKPIRLSEHDIPNPDMIVYSCGYFGDDIVFSDIDALKGITDLLDKSDVSYKLNKEYDTNLSHVSQLSNRYYNSDDMANVRTTKVYSMELFAKVKQLAKENKINTSKYDEAVKAYNAAIDESAWISDDVWDKVNSVRSKYSTLGRLTHLFKYEYMPLSGDDETIAMNFLKKANNVSEESEKYIINNYKNEE